jgi:Fur family ferric uptake transcriptional regulator
MRMRRNKAANAEVMAAQAMQHLRAFLQGRSLRMTGVRESLVRAALSRQDHFRVEDLVKDVEQAGVAVSVATVYRALPLLIEAGLIEPTEISGEKRFYEVSFGREHHDHLICQSCRKVVEFHFEAFEMLQRELAAKYDFELTDHFHELIGICGGCRRKNGSSSVH